MRTIIEEHPTVFLLMEMGEKAGDRNQSLAVHCTSVAGALPVKQKDIQRYPKEKSRAWQI